jgi:hypothetical protein
MAFFLHRKLARAWSHSVSEREAKMSDHWTIKKPVNEWQALVSSGESILDRVHDVAHEIAEHIHQALNANPPQEGEAPNAANERPEEKARPKTRNKPDSVAS